MVQKLRTYLLKEDEGVGTVEVILILMVLIALVLLFREQIFDMIDGIFSNLNESVNELYL